MGLTWPVVVVMTIVGSGMARVTVGAVAAQDSRTTVWDGVYTAEQAARGEAVYAAHCSSCHLADLTGSSDGRPLVGDRFMQDWREDNLRSLFTRIRTLMPFDDPATLGNGAYLESVAYILQANGFPAGSRELTTDRLADIQIEDEDGPGQVPSFALVSVVGCLTGGPDNSWVLTRSAAAVRTDDPSRSSDEQLRAFEAQALGTRSFELLSVYPDPAAHVGHKMEAKGFLIREAAGSRINVSTLGMVGPACDP